MNKRACACLLSALCLMNAFVFTACKQDEGEEETPVTPEKLTYADLYKTEEKKSAPITGAALYKASYGYTLSQEQGYNCFRYEYLKDGAYTAMTYADEAWQGGGAKMSGGTMTPSADAAAVRTFLSPVSGTAHVYGNPRLVSGTSAHVTVLQGSTVVAEYDVTDEYGIYHSHELTLQDGEMLRFVVEGDGEVYWNPTVDFTRAQEVSLHHSVDGYYGDVHPFYDEKTGDLYMYYLSTGMQTQNRVEQFASLLTVSDNFVQYKDTELKMDETNPPEQELYYALGVYVDKDGRYRSSYGKGSYAGGSVSDDLLVWENAAQPYVDEADGLLKYTWRAYFDEGVYSGRDPDICYDAESGTYYCVVMNYYTSGEAQGEKGLALYMAGEDGKFSTKSVRLVDLTGRGDPECPQLKKIGDRWYLLYSVYGTGTAGNVGYLTYRVGDVGVPPEEVDWNSKPEYALEGGDLHAAQMCQVGDMWYMYGWINYRPHANVWGGLSQPSARGRTAGGRLFGRQAGSRSLRAPQLRERLFARSGQLRRGERRGERFGGHAVHVGQRELCAAGGLPPQLCHLPRGHGCLRLCRIRHAPGRKRVPRGHRAGERSALHEGAFARRSFAQGEQCHRASR